ESDKPLPGAVKENLARQYHLDDPLPKQYVDYLINALHGDLGPSYRSVERSVSEIIGATLPVSAQIGLASMLFALVVGVPLGALAAVKHNTWIDYASSLVTVTGLATPPFVRVSLLIVFFSLALGWLPTGGWEGIFDVRSIIPILAIGSGPAAILARYTRSSLLEVRGQDFIRTARAKGLTETAIVAIFASVVAPYPFQRQDLESTDLGPSAAHLLGTDGLGRDELSRLVYGSRISLAVALVDVLIVLVVGVPLGLMAGFFGRWLDVLVMRTV